MGRLWYGFSRFEEVKGCSHCSSLGRLSRLSFDVEALKWLYYRGSSDSIVFLVRGFRSSMDSVLAYILTNIRP